MGSNTFFSGRDALLIAVPFLLIIFFTLFGLDKRLGLGKGQASGSPQVLRPSRGIDENGEPIVRDPDGQLS